MHCHSFEKENTVPKSTESHLPRGFFSCDKAIVRMCHAKTHLLAKAFFTFLNVKEEYAHKTFAFLLSGCTLACSATKFHIHYKLNSYLSISNCIKIHKILLPCLIPSDI